MNFSKDFTVMADKEGSSNQENEYQCTTYIFFNQHIDSPSVRLKLLNALVYYIIYHFYFFSSLCLFRFYPVRYDGGKETLIIARSIIFIMTHPSNLIFDFYYHAIFIPLIEMLQ
jgi:hypothetical protein